MTVAWLLKSDEETCSGDTMVLCKLCWRKQISCNYTTEGAKEINEKPFSILGCTQMPNTAILVAKMDKGQGLVDWFLISVPYAQCPKSSEIQESIGYLATECFDNFKVVHCMIFKFHKDNAVNYKFDDDAEQVLKKMNVMIYLVTLMMPLTMEKHHHPCKKIDLLPQLAAALHVLVYTMECVLAGHEEAEILITIFKDTIEMAKFYLEHVESQKYMFCEVRHTKKQ